jgi:hypothetical protein
MREIVRDRESACVREEGEREEPLRYTKSARKQAK